MSRSQKHDKYRPKPMSTSLNLSGLPHPERPLLLSHFIDARSWSSGPAPYADGAGIPALVAVWHASGEEILAYGKFITSRIRQAHSSCGKRKQILRKSRVAAALLVVTGDKILQALWIGHSLMRGADGAAERGQGKGVHRSSDIAK